MAFRLDLILDLDLVSGDAQRVHGDAACECSRPHHSNPTPSNILLVTVMKRGVIVLYCLYRCRGGNVRSIVRYNFGGLDAYRG